MTAESINVDETTLYYIGGGLAALALLGVTAKVCMKRRNEKALSDISAFAYEEPMRADQEEPKSSQPDVAYQNLAGQSQRPTTPAVF